MYLKTLTQKNKTDGHVRKYLQIVESRRVNGSPRDQVPPRAEEGRIKIIRDLVEEHGKY
jgi:hypothetical protein